MQELIAVNFIENVLCAGACCIQSLSALSQRRVPYLKKNKKETRKENDLKKV